jgi:cephalosporin hydroxylase
VVPPLPRRARPAEPQGAFDPRDWQRVLLRPRVAAWVARQFARLYYARVESTIFGTRYLGIQTLKYPTDLWIYQEIISETLPDVIIETGTWHGGSALYFATVCEAIGHGQVVTIDTDPGEPLPEHPRITYLRGSSTDPETVAQVRELTRDAAGVMAILDSDHSRAHVLRELSIYGDLVTPGGYLVVEDTNVNGRPVLAQHGPGPGEAVDEFVRRDGRYSSDQARERLLLTACPGGFLRRTS